MITVHTCNHITGSAVFRDEEGRHVRMEFHSYCGPMFSYDEFEDGGFVPDEDSVLWDQFEGWQKART